MEEEGEVKDIKGAAGRREKRRREGGRENEHLF